MSQQVQFAQQSQFGGIVRFAVEVALGLNEGGDQTAIWQGPTPDPTWAFWDDPDKGWSGIVPSWVDITPRVLRIQTKRGRDRWEQQFKVGSCQVVLDNQDGIFTPDADRPAGAVALRPGRWLRVLGQRTDDGSPWVPLWTGQIDTMQDQYSTAAHGINAKFLCIDFGGRFQIDDPPALESPIPAGQLTSARVALLLDESNWPDEPVWRDIDTGLHTMAESNLAQSRWAEMQVAATAEGGSMFISAAGVPTFRNRDWLVDKLDQPPKFTVGAPGSQVQVIAAETDWSSQRIYGDIQFARKGGTAYRVTDPDSISLYGPRTYRRLDIECETDTQLQALADRFLAQSRFDRSRLEGIDLVPTSIEGIAQLLNLELGDLIRVTVRTDGEGQWQYTGDFFVQNIAHEIDSSDWVTSLRIEAAQFDVPLLPAAFTDGFDDGFDSQDPE